MKPKEQEKTWERPVILLHRGRFAMDRRYLLNAMPLVLEMQKRIVIVRAEFNFARDSMEYEGCSTLFSEVRSNMITPWYQLDWIADKVYPYGNLVAELNAHEATSFPSWPRIPDELKTDYEPKAENTETKSSE